MLRIALVAVLVGWSGFADAAAPPDKSRKSTRLIARRKPTQPPPALLKPLVSVGLLVTKGTNNYNTEEVAVMMNLTENEPMTSIWDRLQPQIQPVMEKLGFPDWEQRLECDASVSGVKGGIHNLWTNEEALRAVRGGASLLFRVYLTSVKAKLPITYKNKRGEKIEKVYEGKISKTNVKKWLETVVEAMSPDDGIFYVGELYYIQSDYRYFSDPVYDHNVALETVKLGGRAVDVYYDHERLFAIATPKGTLEKVELIVDVHNRGTVSPLKCTISLKDGGAHAWRTLQEKCVDSLAKSKPMEVEFDAERFFFRENKIEFFSAAGRSLGTEYDGKTADFLIKMLKKEKGVTAHLECAKALPIEIGDKNEVSLVPIFKNTKVSEIRRQLSWKSKSISTAAGMDFLYKRHKLNRSVDERLNDEDEPFELLGKYPNSYLRAKKT